MGSALKWRSPAVLTAIGVAATLLLTLGVAITLLLTSGPKALEDNAALIGALVGLGGVFTTQLVNSALEDRRAQGARETEQGQRERELEVALQRSQDDALQAFLDQISQLLTDKERPLRRGRPGDNLSAVARARTLTALTRLDGGRKSSVLQFLHESGLVLKGHTVIELSGADLSEADLRATNLSKANLSATNLRRAVLDAADLRGAELRDADLSEAKLSAANLPSAQLDGADLREANLHAANLLRANLSEADLTGAYLHAANLHKVDLSGADLRKANLSLANLRNAFLRHADLRKADLRDADLREANMSGADLSGAVGITNEELEQKAFSLEGATMPDGSKHS
jgi:uncharacterized protein YjbI with pentapeptide repeats